MLHAATCLQPRWRVVVACAFAAQILPTIRAQDSSSCVPSRPPLTFDRTRSLEGSQAEASFGVAVRTAGDFNGDGYSDLLIGAPDHTDGEFSEGAVFVYLGSDEGFVQRRTWLAQGNVVHSDFGLRCDLAGDVNGDGYSDVIVGDLNFDSGAMTNVGRALVFHGTPSGDGLASWSFRGEQSGEQLGASVCGAGDVNGDGYSDVLVGASRFDGSLGSDQGRVLLFLGSSQGLHAEPAWAIEGEQTRASLWNCTSAGDVNGDGLDDVLISAFNFDGTVRDIGRVYLYVGTPAGLASKPAWFTDGFQRAGCFGCEMASVGDVDGDGFLDIAVSSYAFDHGEHVDSGRVDVYRGSPTGPEFAPSWTAFGDAEQATFGIAIAGGDVDADGFADLLVGAAYNPVQLDFDRGRVFLFRGSPVGLSSTPDWSVQTDQQPVEGLVSGFGRSLCASGDFNGDGYPDVLIGERSFTKEPDRGSVGRVLTYLGGPAAPSCIPDWTASGHDENAEFGHSTSVGDVNGDGLSDVVAGEPRAGPYSGGRVALFVGSLDGIPLGAIWSASADQPKARFGWSVSAGGDVDGDGYDDVLVGAPGHSNSAVDQGRAFLFMGGPAGPPTTPAWSFGATRDGAELGHAVAMAGDVDGDGFADVVVGSPGESRILLFRGGPRGPRGQPDWMDSLTAPGAQLGWAIAGAGDVDGDGCDDVVAGAPGLAGGALDEGRVVLYLGARDGRLRRAHVLAGPGGSARFGHSVAGAGDTDGDGFADVVAGAPLFGLAEPELGMALLYRGSPAGLVEPPAWSAVGSRKYARLGWSVGSAGDTDGDGLVDLVVGAPGLGTRGGGGALLYRGSAAGMEAAPLLVIEEAQSGARSGNAVAGARDVDGDGFGDFLVGAPGFERAGIAAGELRLHLGVAGGAPAMAPRQLRASGTPLALGGSLGSATTFRIRARFARDLAGIGWAKPGATHVWLQWEVAEQGMPFDGLPEGESASQPATGTPLEFDEVVGGLERGRVYRWRARFRTDNPLHPVSDWFTPQGASENESTLRTRTPGRLAPR